MFLDYFQTRKTTLCFTLMFLAAVQLFPAGSSESGSTSRDGTSKDFSNNIEIFVPSWYEEYFKYAATIFMEKHPTVDISIEAYKAEEYKSVLSVRLAAGDPPDMYVSTDTGLDPEWYVYQDFLYKFGKSEIQSSAHPEILELFLENDPYSLPVSIDAVGIAYNKKYFDRRGLTYLLEGDWDDFLHACSAVEQEGNTAIIGDQLSYIWLSRIMYSGALSPDEPNFFLNLMHRHTSFLSPSGIRIAGKLSQLSSFLGKNSIGISHTAASQSFYTDKKDSIRLGTFSDFYSYDLEENDFQIMHIPSDRPRSQAAVLLKKLSISLLDKSAKQNRTSLEFIKFLGSEEVISKYPAFQFTLLNTYSSESKLEFFKKINMASYRQVIPDTFTFYSYLRSSYTQGQNSRNEVLGKQNRLQRLWPAPIQKLITGEYAALDFAYRLENLSEKYLGPLKKNAETFSRSELEEILTALYKDAPKSTHKFSSSLVSDAKQDLSRPVSSDADQTPGGEKDNTPSSPVLQTPRDTQGPSISILYPQIASRGLEVEPQLKELKIIGRVSDESGIFEVTVNGQPASVSGDGSFSKDIRLAYGRNQFTVTAEDVHTNRSTHTFTITRTTQEASVAIPDQVVQAASQTGGEYYALLIGVEDYPDQNINQLSYPIEDANELGKVLSKYYTFDEEHISYLFNPSRREILLQFESLRRSLKENDSLLIYYAGHGYWDEEMRQGYWLPTDARKADRTDWLSNSTVTDYLRAIKIQHILLISDACFSGSIFQSRSAFSDANSSIKEIWASPSRRAITSGKLSTVPDESVFARYLRKRLISNSKHYLYSQKLFTDFRDAVINNSPNRQSPQYGVIQQTGDEGGDFVFVRRQ